MTNIEFNIKYINYLKNGTFGMDITQNKIIKYLDKEFTKEIKINPSFMFSQIKIKLGTTRIYTNSNKNKEWEEVIDRVYLNL